MKNKILTLVAVTFSSFLGVSQAATIVVNTADNTNFSAGQTNLVRALTNLNNNDTITFNIPGAGPHFLETPPGGFPLVIKDNVTIDGYSQPGASPNTNPITSSNNAVIKIVLDSRNGNYRDMEYTLFTPANSSPPIDNSSMNTERGGYGAPERAVLGIYRATNVNIRGLAFLGAASVPTEGEYGIAVAHDYGGDTTVKDRLAYDEGSSRDCHVNGCWFGINPTNVTPEGLTRFNAAIAFFRHREANPPVVPVARPELPNENFTIGVKKGSPNPRAEFNVFAYHFLTLAGEAVRTRFSGNFLGVMPDGVTPTGILPGAFSVGAEIGRYDDSEPMIVGTDGDGINDADEGNLIGPLLNGGVAFGFYTMANKLYIVAGNRFGIAVDGTRWTNSQTIFDEIGSTTKVQFGSDFNGVSDALEANIVYNNHPFAEIFPTPATLLSPRLFVSSPGALLSLRGNTLVNNPLVPFEFASGTGSRLIDFTNYSAPYMDVSGGALIPELSGNSSSAALIGSCAPGTNDYTNIVIDVYLADPEGITSGIAFELPELLDDGNFLGFPQGKTYLGSFVDNGPVDSDPSVGGFNFNIVSLGLPGNSSVTATANYSADPPGTTRGRTHTSNFAYPVSLSPVLLINSVSRVGNTLTISWSGGTPPFSLQKKSPITGGWETITTGINGNSTTDTITSTNAFYRIGGQ